MIKYFQNFVDPFQDYPQTDKPPQKLWPYLWSISGPVRKIMALTALFSVLAALAEVAMIDLLGDLVDRFSSTPPDQIWEVHGSWLIWVTLFIVLIRPVIFSIHIASLFIGLEVNVPTVMRWRGHRHVARQSIGWFENDFAGRIANRVSQTPASAAEVAAMLLEALAYSASFALGALVLLSQINLQLAVPMLLWLALYIGLLWLAVKHITPAAEAHSNARSDFTGRIVDGYTNIHSVKMLAQHAQEERYVREAVQAVHSSKMREMTIFTRLEIALVFLNGFLVMSVVGWAIYLWTHGQASLGIIAAASALVLRLNAMTGWIMWAVVTLFSAIGVVREGMQTLAQPVELLDTPDAKVLRLERGEIQVQALSHHYGRGAGGLDQIDLHVRPGEKIGLVGRSGAGKSTLTKLLLRFYDAEAGRILIDGQDIAQVTQESLRRAIGMVQQDNALLHRSIRDNLTYGRPEATEAEMIAAARQAHAHEFITTLQDSEGRCGYDALVGERGVKLSGGQRQRIALARVILKDAPILVLDEATSALDSEVEAAIQDTLAEMMQGKTVIAIAHRLSTIAKMDRIVVLDQGRVVQDGSHAALLAQGGIYADLWAHQSGGFLGKGDEA